MATTSPLKPYDYQQELINNVFKTLNKSNRNSAFLVSPPGSGKTLMMSEIAKPFTDRKSQVLIFVHKVEIVSQIKQTLARQGVDMNYVQVGMVQTLTRHIDEIKEPALIMVDEAHHAAADTYKKILNAFPKAYHVYTTATPWRADGQGFEELADNSDMVLGPTVKWLIKNKKLAPFDYYSESLYNKENLKSRGGDYTLKSIATESKKVNVQEMIEMYKRFGNNEQGIIYASTVEQSEKITEAFNQAGIKTVHLDGASDDDYRAKMLEEYKQGKIQIISNVQIFTEGIDLPNASVALIARPTKSVALYFQFAMRVLRYKPNKKAKIIDFAGVATNLGLPDRDFEWTLLSNKTDYNELADKMYECGNCFAAFELAQAHTKIDYAQGVQPIGEAYDEKGNPTDLSLPIGKYVYCPKCRKLVTFILQRKNKDFFTDENGNFALMDEQSKETQRLIWLSNAQTNRNQGLVTNAEILKMQNPDLTDNQILISLVKIYLPTWKKTDKPEKVLSEPTQDFTDEHIENMFVAIGETPKIDKFKELYAARKQLNKVDYLRKCDLSVVQPESPLFEEIFKGKLQIVYKDFTDFGDKPSTQQVLNSLVDNLISSTAGRKMSDKRPALQMLYTNLQESGIVDKDAFKIISQLFQSKIR